MRIVAVVISLLVMCSLAGCPGGPESPRGFSLPRGEPVAGQKVFVELRCHDCHSAEGVDIRDAEASDIHLRLGGVSTRITTYADLVTSIINPSHRLSRAYPEEEVAEEGVSKMPVYNDIMTVQELVDLVAYLQPQYEVIVVSPNSYETYYP
jgi:mono/diheme cytochrome c family protein